MQRTWLILHINCDMIVAYHFLPALRTNDNTCRQAEEQKMYFCLHDPTLSPFITYHLILSKSNTMGVTSGAETALSSGVHLRYL
jgi:hypothetical protein